MKLTKKILTGLIVLFACSIVLTAFELKRIYSQNDKGELYFVYAPILEKPFTHLVVNGGNVSNIIYEPAARPSVRVFRRWDGFKENRIKAFVRNDTLYLDFPNTYNDLAEKYQIMNGVMVRIFSPELRSVTGVNTRLELQKFKQKDLNLNISGRSRFEVESLVHDFDKVSVKASDTAEIIFEMSPLLRKSPVATPGIKIRTNEIPEVVKNWDTLHIRSLDAVVSGTSIVDVGHAQIDSIHMNVSKPSAIILSGGAIEKIIPSDHHSYISNMPSDK